MSFNITDFSNMWANFKEELKDYFNQRVVDKRGDTMTGELILLKNPENDMGVVTRKYVEDIIKQNNEFVPGTTRRIFWGYSGIFNARVYDNYSSSTIDFNTKVSRLIATDETSLANGRVLLNYTVPKLDVALHGRQNSNYSMSILSGAEITASVKISANDVVLIEENNVKVRTASTREKSTADNEDSIFFGEKYVSAELPVVIGSGIEFKMSVQVHSLTLPSGYTKYVQNYVDVYTSFGNVNTYVANTLLDSTYVYKT